MSSPGSTSLVFVTIWALDFFWFSEEKMQSFSHFLYPWKEELSSSMAGIGAAKRGLTQPRRTTLQLLGGDRFFPAEIHPHQEAVTSPAFQLHEDHISLDRVSWYNLDGWLTISCAFRKSYATQTLCLEGENSFSLVIKYKNTAWMWWW